MYYNIHGSKKYRDQPERKAELFWEWEAEKEKKRRRRRRATTRSIDWQILS